MNSLRPFSTLIVVTGTLLLVQCAPRQVAVHFYAQKGPEVKTNPYIQGKAFLQSPYQGQIQLKWPDGEEGLGQYSGVVNYSVTRRDYSTRATGYTDSSVGSQSFSGTYGDTDFNGRLGPTDVYSNSSQSVSGSSISRTQAPGTVKIQGMMITNRGRRMEFWAFVGSGSNSGYGMASDSWGNTYKVIF
ncbi:MAG: hypothetical protein ACRCXD_08745 [Luteolibacter sp.]